MRSFTESRIFILSSEMPLPEMPATAWIALGVVTKITPLSDSAKDSVALDSGSGSASYTQECIEPLS